MTVSVEGNLYVLTFPRCVAFIWFNVAGVEDEERTAPALELVLHNVCQRVKIIIVVTGDFPCAKDDVYDKHIAEVL